MPFIFTPVCALEDNKVFLAVKRHNHEARYLLSVSNSSPRYLVDVLFCTSALPHYNQMPGVQYLQRIR